jgi:hypothetical protein
VQFQDSACSEWQFLSHIAQTADCLLLLDVNNVYVSSVNHGFDAMDYLRGLPAQRIQQVHLAGHSQQDGYIIDTHDHPVCQEVWSLYAKACALLGDLPTMIERDDHIPPLKELLEELSIARDIASAQAAPQPHSAISLKRGALTFGVRSAPPPTSLSDLQDQWVASILSAVSASDAPIIRQLQAGHRFGVYHHAYTARLSEALADVFEKTLLFMGSGLFDQHAKAFCIECPPQTRSLNTFGEGFAAHLKQAYPSNPELWQLAELEWQLRRVYDAADHRPLTQEDIQKDTAQAWLHHPNPLARHAHAMIVTHSVAAIWNAIHLDQEVPEVQALSAPSTLLIWRKGTQPHFQSQSGTHAALIQAMLSGDSIAQACERCAEALAEEPADFLASSLSQWLSAELLVKAPQATKAPHARSTQKSATKASAGVTEDAVFAN